jgi:hypothetical protein
MNPGVYNLDIYRGDTFRRQFKLWSDTKRTIATDLTGVTVNASIRDKALGGSFEQPLDCVVTLPNIIDMVLLADLSRSLPAVGVWDLQLTYPSADVYTPLKGAVIVTQDVTRPVIPVVQVVRAR